MTRLTLTPLPHGFDTSTLLAELYNFVRELAELIDDLKKRLDQLEKKEVKR